MNQCPLPTPASRYSAVTLAHGGGGTRTDSLIHEVFLPAFGMPSPTLGDSSPVALQGRGGRVAVTTDAHVVRPLFFPGGDIGKLSVTGTVNDLLVAGARPVALTAGFILEEGLSMETLRRVVASMQTAARDAGVTIVAGDTKVVERRGEGDGLFITTAGIGEYVQEPPPAPERIQVGDVLLLTGDLARHGMAVMAERHDLHFSQRMESDCAALTEPLLDLYAAGLDVHAARDPTRGGLGGVLCEWAAAAQQSLEIEEEALPVHPAVRAACELLGFDPLDVANEGCVVLAVSEAQADVAVARLRNHSLTAQTCRIGRVLDGREGHVTVRTALGTVRRLTPPAGEPLPRIC